MVQGNGFENACKLAAATAPAIVGWLPRVKDWVVYKVDDVPDGVEPDLLFLTTGKVPLVLSEIGAETFMSLIAEKARKL